MRTLADAASEALPSGEHVVKVAISVCGYWCTVHKASQNSNFTRPAVETR